MFTLFNLTPGTPPNLWHVESMGAGDGSLIVLVGQSEKALRPREQLNIEGRSLAWSSQGAG